MTIPNTLFRYIARQFLQWFAASFTLILALVFIGDFIELIRRAAGLADVRTGALLRMALLQLPFNAQEAMPFAVLIGSILALWRMTRSQELVIARAAGISVWQFLMPAVALAFLIGVIGVTAFNPLASAMQATYAKLDETVLRHRPSSTLLDARNLWIRQSNSDGTQAVLHGIRLTESGITLQDVTILFFDTGDQVARRIDAANARLEDGQWTVADAWDWRPNFATPRHLDRVRIPTVLTTTKIEDSLAAPDTLSFWALPQFIDLLEQAGFSAQRHRLYFDSLLARPFLLCAMVLIAAVFSLRMQRRGGTTVMLIGGVAAGFLLYFLSDVVFALGSSSVIPVALAAWTPAGISTLLGITFLLHLEDG